MQDVINYADAAFDLDEDMIKMKGLKTENVVKNADYFGNIKSYSKVALNEPAFDIFKLKDLVLHDLVCNQHLMEIIKDRFPSISCYELSDTRLYNNRFRQ